MLLAERDGFHLRIKTVGIIGVGNVGSRLDASKRWAYARCCAIRRVPIAATPGVLAAGEAGGRGRRADTPLNKSGPYHLLHLADADLLQALPDNRILTASPRAGGG